MSYRPKDMVEVVERYGHIQKAPDGRYYWPGASQWVKACYLPKEISKYLVNTVDRKPVERIFCNSDMHEPLLAAMDNLLSAGAVSELKTFDGCYNVRYVRGSDSVFSMHSWALAIDLNAKDNPLSSFGTWSDRFIRCFTDEGWIWGGDFKSRKDPMHFEWCGTPRAQVRLNS